MGFRSTIPLHLIPFRTRSKKTFKSFFFDFQSHSIWKKWWCLQDFSLIILSEHIYLQSALHFTEQQSQKQIVLNQHCWYYAGKRVVVKEVQDLNSRRHHLFLMRDPDMKVIYSFTITFYHFYYFFFVFAMFSKCCDFFLDSFFTLHCMQANTSEISVFSSSNHHQYDSNVYNLNSMHGLSLIKKNEFISIFFFSKKKLKSYT